MLLNKKRRINRVSRKMGLEQYDSVEDLFTDYYRNRTWSGGKAETVSGSGSTMKKTEILREKLPELLQRHGVRTLFDAPCGDYNWFQHLNRPGVKYIGGDIVAEMIEANQHRFGDADTSFRRFDILKDTPPVADLWFCRDVILHFSNDLIFEFFRNFVRSPVPLLLISTYHKSPENIDIPTGAGRPVNLEIPPFSLPAPIDFIDDDIGKKRPKQMGLWERSTLENHLRSIGRL